MCQSKANLVNGSPLGNRDWVHRLSIAFFCTDPIQNVVTIKRDPVTSVLADDQRENSGNFKKRRTPKDGR